MAHIDKRDTIQEYQQHEKDTGSIEVQIASLTHRINQLNGHLKLYPRDFSTKHGLIKLVGQRRSFLAYLQRTNAAMYKKLIDRLGLRR